MRLGAYAVLDNDLTYKGTIVPPSTEHLLAQVDPTIVDTYVFSYAARGVSALTYYRDGAIYGLLRYIYPDSSQDMMLFAYRFPLALLRLPQKEGAALRLVGGGAHGDMLIVIGSSIAPNSLSPHPGSGRYQRLAATATQALGLGAAAAGSLSAQPESVTSGPEILTLDSANSLSGAAAVAGAPGVDLGGTRVGGGGSRAFFAPVGTSPGISSNPLVMLGGYAGEEKRLEAPPGALLAFVVGRGGRLSNSARNYDPQTYQRFHLSVGQDGGALVEWEEWA
ncbi:hypothetical protein VZ95_11230 [Elstera litoralis]|uniref:Uncharacterized protein n=1 Tax=Elstera litoralis TaxID=552518 RepID=A0A0F3IRZ1_9PROT|nr:hypothetical protein [Elstera litoralis]KJV09481.1 hypothetical protein VZ95_11230 [Elstera litoralis]